MTQPSGNPAELYERHFVPAMFLPWAEVLLRHAALRIGERVLDVGCGTGIVARQAAGRVGAHGQVTAVDLNPGMLAVARAAAAPSGAAIRWEEGNAMALPFPDGAFDVVLCQHGLQFFPDRARAVQEMRRVLSPRGRAAAIVLQSLALHPVFEALMRSVARHLALPIEAVMTPFALDDADDLRRLFASAGFGSVDVVAESVRVRFPEPERFVPLAVGSSAAAVPAFAQLEGAARCALVESVRRDVEATLRSHVDLDAVAFPMYAHVAVCRR